jgi:hypothetical protein
MDSAYFLLQNKMDSFNSKNYIFILTFSSSTGAPERKKLPPNISFHIYTDL